MPRAVWNDVVLAESDNTVKVEGNHYFPVNSINKEYFKKSQKHSVCPWKGTANYYDIEVDGKVNQAAAWYYPKPSKAASKIKNHVAFWGGIKVEGSNGASGGGLLSGLKSLFGG